MPYPRGQRAASRLKYRTKSCGCIRACAFLLLYLFKASGCATVPDVKAIIERSYAAGRPPAIVGADGRLSPKESRDTLAAFVYARNAIHLTNAYVVPDQQTGEALTGAARRGVDVKIILPGGTDIPITRHAGRYHYTRLLEAGVKLYEHQSAVLQAKTAVIDGVWSTVGSTNMDTWSFVRNDEVNTVILSREFAKQMEDMYAQDLSDSREIRLEEWDTRPLLPRIREWSGYLITHWL